MIISEKLALKLIEEGNRQRLSHVLIFLSWAGPLAAVGAAFAWYISTH